MKDFLILSKLLILIILCFQVSCSSGGGGGAAQSLSIWTNTVQDGVTYGTTKANSVAIDSTGNVYLTGFTTRAIDGQSQHGSYDLFVTKYNSSGIRQWTIQDGAATGVTQGTKISCDSSGNVYVTGYTSIAIGGQTQHGSVDSFVTKYSPSGVWQWTNQDGGPSGTTQGEGLTVDSSGNVYVVGSTTVGIDGQTQHGTSDFFFSKFDSSGVRQWTWQDGGGGGSSVGMHIAADASNNLYIVGYTSVAIDGQTQHGLIDLFLTKFTSGGSRQWTLQDGGPSGATTEGLYVAIDSNANIYVTGYTNMAIDGQSQHGADDLFLSKYNASGSRQWTVQDGATGGNTQAWGLATDSSGNAYVTGFTSAAIDGQTQHGTEDYFISKYSSLGTRQWSAQNGSSAGTTQGMGIVADQNGNALAVGGTTVGIDGQTQSGNEDLFITAYKSSGSHP